jgi:Arc/MetJ-type ribon-helix-helix transcriptional regulator
MPPSEQIRFASILPKGSARVFTSIRPCNLRDSESSKICYHPYGWRGADELSETEKITINLGLVDLGQIDLLVQEGFYQNRTDFIRTAIRNQLNAHADAVKQTVARKDLVLGLQHYARPDLEAVREAGETLEIRVLGLANIADDVPPELARETIDSIDVLGAFRASPDVKAALAGRIRST